MKSFKFLDALFSKKPIADMSDIDTYEFASKEDVFLKVKMGEKFLIGKLDHIAFMRDYSNKVNARLYLKYSNFVNGNSSSGWLPFKIRKSMKISRISEKDYKKIACIT